MTELTLSPRHDIAAHQTTNGYAANRRRSPSAFIGAIALNGGVFALILALPATQYIIAQDGGLITHNIPLDNPPPEIKPDPVKHQAPNPTQKTVPQQDEKPFIQPPLLPLPGTGPAIGGTIPDPGTLGGTGVDLRPVDPPHVAVFKGATRDPRYAQAFHPDYPPSLRRQGLEGSVTVRITIDETGRVTAVELIKATDKAFFEETREQALRYWRFRPATSDGAAVPSQQTLTVQFHLEDE